MKIASWNLNSLNVRLGHLLDWLAQSQTDIVCLQELKLPNEKFPLEQIQAAGYHAYYSGQKTYNGVAILSRADTVGPAQDILIGNPHYDDPQQRLITASFGTLRVTSAYFPNGQEVGSEKFAYKLEWLTALQRLVAEQLSLHPEYVLAGDFNITVDDRDVHSPDDWRDKIHCSVPERTHLNALFNQGLHDSFRLFEAGDKLFSWWDYRQLGFRRNAGLRIDYVLLTEALKSRAIAAGIDKAPRKLEQPSDHAPAWVTLS
jgi:exodeoxyribonuclease III